MIPVDTDLYCCDLLDTIFYSLDYPFYVLLCNEIDKFISLDVCINKSLAAYMVTFWLHTLCKINYKQGESSPKCICRQNNQIKTNFLNGLDSKLRQASKNGLGL